MKTSIAAALLIAALFVSGASPAGATPPTPDQEAVIQQEVRSRMHGFVAAIERADFAATWGCIAEVPGFQWVDIDGKTYGLADTKQSWEASMGQCRSMKYPMLQERVIVHGPDTATYVTNCTGEFTLKDGTVLTRGTFTFSGLLQRMDGTWKIVFCQESSLPPQPVAPAPMGTAEPQKAALPATAPVAGVEPAQPERKIVLNDAPLDRRFRYTAWRTDYYICTGIAYAKSLGHTVEEFAAFVASQHDIGTTSADGLTKIAQLSYFVLTNYPKGQVMVTAESDVAVTMEFNRAYLAYFGKGPVLGVTVDEFERCFWGHFAIMARRNGFGFTHRIEAEKVTFTISLEKRTDRETERIP